MDRTWSGKFIWKFTSKGATAEGCEETYTHGIWGVTKVAETPKEK